MTEKGILNRLREIRILRGLSQRQLARTAGIHHPAINRIEGGQRTPTYRTMKKIAKALETDVFQIFP